jgi:hypothetical protein
MQSDADMRWIARFMRSPAGMMAFFGVGIGFLLAGLLPLIGGQEALRLRGLVPLAPPVAVLFAGGIWVSGPRPGEAIFMALASVPMTVFFILLAVLMPAAPAVVGAIVMVIGALFFLAPLAPTEGLHFRRHVEAH